MTEEEGKTNLWDRKPGETNLWYSRFEDFRLLGPERTVAEVYRVWLAKRGMKASKKLPGRWSREALRWQWVIRAEAWDAAERERLRQRHEKEIDQLFEHVEKSVRLIYAKLTKRLESLDPNDVPAAVLVPNFMAVIKKMEELFDRVPANKLEVTGKGGRPLVDLEAHQQLLRDLDILEQQIRKNDQEAAIPGA